MTIFTNAPITPGAPLANAAALRAVASAGLTAQSVSAVIEGAGIASYLFVPASLAVDSGADPTVRRPNDILPANPGRWIVFDWPDSVGVPMHGEFLLPQVVNATGPCVCRVQDGWTIIGVTEVGGVRTAWLKKLVALP